jgi:hypothetical protein
MIIRLRRINGDDINLEFESIDTLTVTSLRQRVAELLAITDLPSIRLIHGGRVMVDDDDRLLSYYIVEDGAVVHLVLRNSNTSSTTATSTPSPNPEPQPQSSSRPTPTAQPQMRYQQIGDGILMGTMELTGADALSFINSLSSQPIAGILPVHVPRPSNTTTATTTAFDSSHRRSLVTRPRYSQHFEDSMAALNILSRQLENPHIEASFRSIEDSSSTEASLSTVLANLSLCLSSIQVPVQSIEMRLSNGRFLAHDASQNQAAQERVNRSQELIQLSMTMRALSQASRYIANALESVTIGSVTGAQAPRPAPESSIASPNSNAAPRQNDSQVENTAIESSGDDPAMMVDRDEPDDQQRIPDASSHQPDNVEQYVEQFIDSMAEQFRSGSGASLSTSANSTESRNREPPSMSAGSETPIQVSNFAASTGSFFGRLASETLQQILRPPSTASTTPARSTVQSTTGTPPPSANSPDDEDSPANSNPPLD